MATVVMIYTNSARFPIPTTIALPIFLLLGATFPEKVHAMLHKCTSGVYFFRNGEVAMS